MAYQMAYWVLIGVIVFMAVLTDTKARNVKPNDKPIPHGGVAGLTLHPSKSHKGQGKWVFRYVSPVTNKRRNAGVGTYPEIGIAKAGEIAREMREQLANKIDPLDERKRIEEEQNSKPEENVIVEPSFEEAAHEVHQELLPSWRNPKHAQQWINTLKTYAFPVLGNLRLSEITPKLAADVLRPIWLEKPETARRLLQRINAIMDWGFANEYCLSNSVSAVSRILPAQPSKTITQQHHPAMPWKDIPEYIKKCLNPDNSRNVSEIMLEFLILTAARSGEVRGMTWSEVDFEKKTWTVPAGRMKAKVEHKVPLSNRAIKLLKLVEGRHEELVFPSPSAQTILSDMVLTELLKRTGAKSDDENRHATAHGFRSSFRDWCSENGYARDLAERALAHTISNKVEAAYHRTDLLEQRRPMMQKWANFVTGNDAPTNVAEAFNKWSRS